MRRDEKVRDVLYGYERVLLLSAADATALGVAVGDEVCCWKTVESGEIGNVVCRVVLILGRNRPQCRVVVVACDDRSLSRLATLSQNRRRYSIEVRVRS
jgi:hypothetical protein